MIDSHCHLADDGFVADLPEVVGRAQAAGLSSALCILSADEPGEVGRVARLREAWPAINFAASVHPHRSGAYAGRAVEAGHITRAVVTESRAVAVGEIGLDYHYDYSPRDVQRAVFEAQLDVARAVDRPVIIHTREAGADTIAILRAAGLARRGVMHCFSGTADEAREALDLGFFLSLSGILTFPKADALRDVSRFVPADWLLIETDAPFLAPVPYRGRRNEPAWVAETLKRLADVRSVTVEAMDAQLADNFQTLFHSASAPTSGQS